MSPASLSVAIAQEDGLTPDPDVSLASREPDSKQIPAPPGGPSSSQPKPQSRFHLWTHRLSFLMFVLISAIAGVLLVILPWTPEWTDNYLLLSYPGLRTFVASPFFRGFCSGLGLLDIWIGFSEAIHYHERS